MKNFVRLSPCLLCLLTIIGQPLCGEVVSDNFNDNALSRSLWSPVVMGGGSAVETNQRLEITGGGAPGAFRSGVALRGTVAGDFDIQVGFTLLAPIDSLSKSNDVGVGLVAAVGLPVETNHFVLRVAGGIEYSFEDKETSVPYSGQSGKLRMTRIGAVYSFYYRSGGDWQLMYSAVGRSTSAVQFFLGVGGNGPVSVSSAFDDFLLQADQVNWEVPAAIAIPHLAAGDSWMTEVIVANTSDQARQFSINFYDDNGSPLVLPVTGMGNVSVLSETVPAHGTAYYEVADRAGPLRTGWGAVSSDSSVNVQALFRNRAGSGLHYEAAVPSTAGGSRFVMPFDATTFVETGAPFYTGFAVVNLDSAATVNISCTARDGGAALIPNGVSIPPVPPRGHYANYLFPNLAGKRGTLDCTSSANVAALGLRFIGTAAFTSLSVYTK